jgi:hypothetical protein
MWANFAAICKVIKPTIYAPQDLTHCSLGRASSGQRNGGVVYVWWGSHARHDDSALDSVVVRHS